MTKEEAYENIFEDGQPVFRHIDNALTHLEGALCLQQQRLKSAKYLNKINWKLYENDPKYCNGKTVLEEELYLKKMLNDIVKQINTYYKKFNH